MRLEDLEVDLRPRTPRQAVDLGLWILRRHGRLAWSSWACVWTPLVAIVALLSFLPWGALWAPSLLWWIRPLPERLVLTVLSRGTFGQDLSLSGALRAWWREGRSGIWRFCGPARPLGIGRCLVQPVWQLEGADPTLASRRCRQLAQGGAGSAAAVWGLACSHFEACLAFGIVAFFGLFLPHAALVDPFALLSDPASFAQNPWVGMVGCLAYGAASGMVGPFYAAGGFSLYLARRSELEAWDIEISLRRLLRRVGRTAGALIVVLSISILAFPAKVGGSSCADSQTMATRGYGRGPSMDSGQALVRHRLDSVLSAPRLRDWECRSIWVLRQTAPQARNADDGIFLAWLRFLAAAAPLLKWAVLLGVFGITGWLLWRYRSVLALSEIRSAAEIPAAFPEASAPEALPSDPVTRARELWEQDRPREALSLLYRATVESARHLHALAIPTGTTEGRFLSSVRALPPPRAESAREVVVAWSALAWARRAPSREEFHALLDRWTQAWSRP